MRWQADIPRFGGGGGGGGGSGSQSGGSKKGGGTDGEAGFTPSPLPGNRPGVPGLTQDQAMQQAAMLYGIPGPQLNVLPQNMFPSSPLAALYHAVMQAQQPQQFQQPGVNPNMQFGYRPMQ